MIIYLKFNFTKALFGLRREFVRREGSGFVRIREDL